MNFYHFIIIMMLSSVLTFLVIDRRIHSQVDISQPCQDVTIFGVEKK